MSEIARAYASGDIKGWGGGDNPKLVKSAFDLLAPEFQQFQLSGQTQDTKNRKTFLLDAVKLVTGGTFLDVQQTGDCVSFGAKHASEIVTCTQIIGLAVAQQEQSIKDYINEAKMKFRRIFAPYYYGTGRLYEGAGRLGREAGSLGSWQFVAAKKYGALFEDEPGVPKYSKQVADEWGYDKKFIEKWRTIAAAYPVQSGAPITNWRDFCDAIHNGYSVTTSSSFGYSMEPGSDGFHIQNCRWDHQMDYVGCDETWCEPYAELLNQWGDVHGHLKDFQTGEPRPPGIIRTRRSDVEKHLSRGECYAYSSFKGFPEQRLDKALFLLI